MAIQALLVRQDVRGIARRTAAELPADNVEAVAKTLYALRHDTVFVATGFFVRNHPETDGPPGAIALARSLTTLGARVVLVSRRDALNAIKPFCDFEIA